MFRCTARPPCQVRHPFDTLPESPFLEEGDLRSRTEQRASPAHETAARCGGPPAGREATPWAGGGRRVGGPQGSDHPGTGSAGTGPNRKSTRLNSSPAKNSHPVSCWKKKIIQTRLQGLEIAANLWIH